MCALQRETYPERPISLEDYEAFLGAVPAHLALAAEVDGRPVGFVLAALEEGHAFAETDLGVRATWRRRGLGRALHDAALAWAREAGAEGLEAWAYEAEPAGEAFARALGYAAARRESFVVLELAGLEPPDPAPPPGVEIRPWSELPGVERALYAVAAEAVPDIPGEEDEPFPPFRAWLEQDMSGPSDRRDATFVALARGEVVGFAKLHLSSAQPEVATHDLTGVLRAWRGRGIAGALKRTQVAWAAANGYARLKTANEVRNEPIRRLNEALGYRPVPGRALMRPAAPPRSA